MNQAKKTIPAFIAAICFLILIIDTKTAMEGVQDGIALCLKTLIPSLFPFFIVSSLFCMYFSTIKASYLLPILRPCNISSNAISLLIIGLIGGYPAGAKAISEAYDRGTLTLSQAQRMLGFCNNAGPAFVFGMISRCFSAPVVCIIIQLILIASALIAGMLLPGKSFVTDSKTNVQLKDSKNLMDSNIKAMASVCAWVIVFRVIIKYFKKWFLWILPKELEIILIGILELSNASTSLNIVSNDGLRFIIATGMLSFGGLCVYMQTAAVTKNTGIGFYLPGKFLQLTISTTLAIIAQQLIFPKNNVPIVFIAIPIVVLLVQHFCTKIYYKKTVAFSDTLVYNRIKNSSEAWHALS